MQAVILATADSNKLWPLTASTPSPLLSIGNRPVMEIVLEQLARAGFKKVIICLHKMAGNIELYFGDGRRWGVSLEYVLTRESWGSAGILGWAKSLINETFVVMPADVIVDLDIIAALEHHRLNGNAATVILNKNKNQAVTSITPEDANSQKGSGTGLLSEQWCSETGAYILQPEALKLIPAKRKYDISSHLLPALSEAGMLIGAYVTEGYWNPLDSFCEFQDAQRTLLNSLWKKDQLNGEVFLSNYSQLVGREIHSGVWVGRNTIIHPSAQFVPPVLLGENTRIGQDVVLGPEVVIGAGTMVSDRVSIHSSTIFEHTYIGQLLHIENRLVDKALIVDATTSEHINIADHFLLSETPRSIPVALLARFLEFVLVVGFLLVSIPITLSIGLFSWISFGHVFETKTVLRGEAIQTDHKKADKNIVSMLNFRTRSAAGKPTRISRWLERLEWNRLPELLSVLNGNLRLVGTKPIAQEEMSEFAIIWQPGEPVHTPGFTGLWYIQNDPYDGLDENLVSNFYYLATQSLKHDVQILLKTPRFWIKRIKNQGCETTALREE